MFFGREMQDPAVWTDYAEAFRTCMMIRSKHAAIVVPWQMWNSASRKWDTEGYCIYIMSPDDKSGMGGSIVRKGLIAALMARHECFEERTVDGKKVSVQIMPTPEWNDVPFFKVMPRERPAA